MGLFITLVSQASSDKVNEKNYERTIQSMQEIKKAILGTHSERVRGDIRFAGYVPDMGDLPELIDGQPRGLWTYGKGVDKDNDGKPDGGDLDGDGEIDLPFYTYYEVCDPESKEYPDTEQKIFLGWNGPYLRPPAGGVLKDGWGNPFIFKRIGNNFIIMSLGADGKQGGTGYDKDISVIINENDWLGCVAGYISPHVIYTSKDDIERDGRSFPDSGDLTEVKVHIYYKPKKDTCKARGWGGWGRQYTYRCVDELWQPVGKDGYFHFDGVPIGTDRLLAITQEIVEEGKKKDILQPYKIDIEPGINWLGNMGSVP